MSTFRERILHTPTAEASEVSLTLIAAMDDNGLIGAHGGMPWHLPGDLRWFKQHTLDKPILMGRRTFESIGRALPRRRNLVLTRDPDLAGDGIEAVADVDTAMRRAGEAGAPELMVIGGAQVYALTMARAERLLITRIEARYAGDTWFPEVNWPDWELLAEQRVAAAEARPAHRFMTWQRRAA